MTETKLKNLFYSAIAASIFNFLFGIASLYAISFWLPFGRLKDYADPLGLVMLCIPFFVGILPALSYNLIRFCMVTSKELNYGIWSYALSTILPLIAPMLIYSIVWPSGFIVNW